MAEKKDRPDKQKPGMDGAIDQTEPSIPELNDGQPEADQTGELPDLADLQAPDAFDEANIAGDGEDKIMDQLLGERDALKDQLLRAMADVENMRRRTERDMQAARKYGHLAFARDMLASIDNLNQALAAAPQDRQGLDDGLVQLLVGLEMVVREIDTVLERHQISRIDPLGEKFDYNFHQAMFEIPTDEAEPGTVMQVAQTGYRLDDRLLRPAMVGVAKPASAEPEDKS